jgi:UDP-N-acetylmuramate--alanine ligase
MLGRHNVQNALAAIAVGLQLGVGGGDIRKGLAAFGGVRRRFTTTGIAHGVRVIDDYGHHPVEIAAVLAAARGAASGRVVAVVQPHRYSRLRDLFADFSACFDDADVVIVADVYPAGEAPIEGVSRDALMLGLRRHGHPRVLALASPADLPAVISAEVGPGDLVVFLGAGDITTWAHALPAQLEALADELA